MIATPLALTADPDAAGLDALFEKVAAEFAAPLTRVARAAYRSKSALSNRCEDIATANGWDLQARRREPGLIFDSESR